MNTLEAIERKYWDMTDPNKNPEMLMKQHKNITDENLWWDIVGHTYAERMRLNARKTELFMILWVDTIEFIFQKIVYEYIPLIVILYIIYRIYRKH